MLSGHSEWLNKFVCLTGDCGPGAWNGHGRVCAGVIRIETLRGFTFCRNKEEEMLPGCAFSIVFEGF